MVAKQSAQVLLIDDQPSLVEFMERALDGQGHAIRAVSDSRQARALVESAAFDLIVSDIVMPHLHGLELLRVARRAQPSARVLFVTGYPNRQIVVEALEQGAIGILEKPFTADEFVAAVAQALAEARSADGRRAPSPGPSEAARARPA